MLKIILLFAIIIAILKLFNLRYQRRTKSNEQNLECDISLMSKRISHSKYEKVSKKTSPSNTIQRVKGDYLDFILESDYTDSQSIENKILNIYGEDLA